RSFEITLCHRAEAVLRRLSGDRRTRGLRLQCEVATHALQASRIDKVGKLDQADLRWVRLPLQLDAYCAVGADRHTRGTARDRDRRLQLGALGRDNLPRRADLETAVT